MEERGLGAILALIGISVVLAVPKLRRRLKRELVQIGTKIREGSEAAVERFKKEKEISEVVVKTRRKRKKVAPRPKPVEVMATQPASVPSIIPANAEFEERILDKIKSSPAGKTLTELGKDLGTHFVRLAQPLKKLVSEGKIRKQEKLYFAVA